MKDYENLSPSPMSHLFQNDLQQHANTTTTPSTIAKNNRYQTTRMVSFLEFNHFISTTNTIIPIDADADNDYNDGNKLKQFPYFSFDFYYKIFFF
jgi:hypothetical protein